MKKYLLSCFIAFAFLPAFTSARDFRKPDYDSIRKATQTESSLFFYPKLMARYSGNDTLISPEEFRALYFGFLFQPGYSPYKVSIYADSVRALFSKDSLQPVDFPRLIAFETEILKDDPFSLRDLNVLAYACEREGDTVGALVNGFKLGRIAETILFSGDGKSEETAWHVIQVSHEYDLLNLLGFTYSGPQSLTEKGCDYLQVQENQFGIGGFYFDVNRILDAEKNVLKDQVPDKQSKSKKKKKEKQP
jgi:hypothetical protein